MRIAIIVCDNGLGHMRRSISIAKHITNFGYLVDILGRKKHFEHLMDSLSLTNDKIKCINCDFGYNFEYFYNKNPKEFSVTQNIPPLDKYGIVLSDNIIEVLSIRNDAFLVSQFFWHEILPDINKGYKSKCRELIRKTAPTIFGDKYFSMQHIRKKPNYFPTGLYNLNPSKNRFPLKSDTKKRNLLISGGNTLQAHKLFTEFVQFILQNKPKGIDLIFVDKKIFPKKCPSWVKKGTFETKMFESLIGCICRPGIGTITDCIQYGIKIFTLHESENLEMLNNSRILSELSLGEKISEKSSFIRQIEDYCNDYQKYLTHIRKCKSINLEGPLEISKYLFELSKNNK